MGRREQIDETERHHLRVRRVANGERVALRDGAGLVGTGRLVADGAEWLVEVETVERRRQPAGLTLAVGTGDRERFGWMVEKAVELGATAVVPLETERTAGVATRLQGKHLGKVRRQALEAIKQCGAAWVLDLEPPIPLAEFAARTSLGRRWLADPEGAAATGCSRRRTDDRGGRPGRRAQRARAGRAGRGGIPPDGARGAHASVRDRRPRGGGGVTTARLRGTHG